jgi:hypothetical protein
MRASEASRCVVVRGSESIVMLVKPKVSVQRTRLEILLRCDI